MIKVLGKGITGHFTWHEGMTVANLLKILKKEDVEIVRIYYKDENPKFVAKANFGKISVKDGSVVEFEPIVAGG